MNKHLEKLCSSSLTATEAMSHKQLLNEEINEMLDVIRCLKKVVESELLPNVRHLAIQDFHLLNRSLMRAANLLN